MMTKPTNIGSEVLEEAWHATKRSASDVFGAHEIGMDVLGAALRAGVLRPAAAPPPPPPKSAQHVQATPPSAPPPAAHISLSPAPTPQPRAAQPRSVMPSPVTRLPVAAGGLKPGKKVPQRAKPKANAANIKSSAQRVGQRAVMAGKKLAGRRFKSNKNVAVGKKAQSMGNRLIKLSTSIAGVLVGAVIGAISQDQIDKIIQMVAAFTDGVNALNDLTELYGVLQGQVDATTDPTMQSQGQAILDSIYNLYVNFNDNPGNSSEVDTTVVSKAAALKTQAQSWQRATGVSVTNPDGSVTTTNPDGTTTTTNPDGTTTTGSAKPVIQQLSASSGAPGDVITVTGTGFTPTSVPTVDFNGVQAQFSVDSPTQVSVMVPPGATSGVMHVGVATAMFSIIAADPSQFDPGTAGGGGGGGGFDESESGGGGGAAPDRDSMQEEGGGGYGGPGDAENDGDALARFRASGGNWDPFAEQQDGGGQQNEGQYASADAEPSQGMEDEDQPLPEDEPIEDDGSSAASIFRQSGGAIDPLATDEEKAEALAGFDPSFESTWKAVWDPAAPPPPVATTGDSEKTTVVNQGQVSPEVAARLAAAQKKLADAKGQLYMAHMQRARASGGSPAAGVPTMSFADRLAASRASLTEMMGVEMKEPEVEMHEEGDIFVDNYQHQITDEKPDPMRKHGSTHQGAAYLQHETYPPWGASSGQEGGSMDPLDSDVIFGAAYRHGLDAMATPARRVLATTVKTKTGPVAVPKRAGFVLKKTPAGNKHTSLVPIKPSQSDNLASVRNARQVGTRAISIGNKLLSAVSRATRVHGAVPHPAARPRTLGPVKPGASAKAGTKRGPKMRLTPAQLKQVAQNAIKAGKTLQKQADKHEKMVKTVTAQKKAMRSPKVMLHGDVFGQFASRDLDLREDEVTVLGAMLDVMGQSMPDPNDPGWLMDGTVDPNYGGTAAPASTAPPDPNNPGFLTDGTLDPNYGYGTGSADYPGPPDYGLGPAPTVAPPLQPGVDYTPDPGPETDQTAYSSDTSKAPGAPLPVGAIICDFARGTPQYAVGSFNHFYGGKDGLALNTQGWWGGGIHHDAGWMIFRNAGQNMDTVEPEEANGANGPYVPQLQQFSLSRGAWGPLVGNPMTSAGSVMPAHSWTYGLRYDAGGDRWFWYRDKAPAWATAADDMQRLNQAILDYKTNLTAAAADAAARAAADQLEQEQAKQLQKQQAAEDAAAQRQMDQEQAQMEHDAQLQSVADEAAARQQERADEAAARQAQQQADLQSSQYSAQSDADMRAWQAQQLTQAQIDQQAAETAAKLEMQAQMMQAQMAAMQPPQDGSADYVPEDAPVDGGGDGEVPVAAMPSEFDLARALLEEDAPASSEDDVMGLRGSDRIRARRDGRR